MPCTTYWNRGCVRPEGDGEQPELVCSCYTSSVERLLSQAWAAVPICVFIHSTEPCKYRPIQPAMPESDPRYLEVVNLFLHVSSSGNKQIAKNIRAANTESLLRSARSLLNRVLKGHRWPLAPAHKWYSVIFSPALGKVMQMTKRGTWKVSNGA